MDNIKELKVGKLYRVKNAKNEDRNVVVITKRYYYKSRGRKGETQSGWMFEYSFIDKPDDKLGAVEQYIIDHNLLVEI